MIDLVSFQINSCGENDNQVVQVENSTHIPIGVVFITFGWIINFMTFIQSEGVYLCLLSESDFLIFLRKFLNKERACASRFASTASHRRRTQRKIRHWRRWAPSPHWRRTTTTSTTLTSTSLIVQRWVITTQPLMAQIGGPSEGTATKSLESPPLTRKPMLRFDSIADLGPWVFIATMERSIQSLRGGIKWHLVVDWAVEFSRIHQVHQCE